MYKYIYIYIYILYHKIITASCEIDDFVETPLCKLHVTLRSCVQRVLYCLMQYISNSPYMTETRSEPAEFKELAWQYWG